jgi:hypothetical protein
MKDLPPADGIGCRYPPGYRFAFTIVHDADSAYSGRLAPLFDVFDDLGLRITASAFAFWANWARGGDIWTEWRNSSLFTAPVAVPLCDPAEQRFYQDLSARGHEVALHTPSDTSNTTEEVEQAFELFHEVFGHHASVYVEHSARSNKDAQSNEGANPDSPYYCRDVLLRYDPWVWVDGTGALRDNSDGKFFEIPPGVSPLNPHANERYGLSKAFMRTGRWARADGDGFLECYSEENIDTLERDGGIALVYTHLDYRWLDPATRRMRRDIEARLRYLAAKPGWFVPAREILDRVCGVAVPVEREGRPAGAEQSPCDR